MCVCVCVYVDFLTPMLDFSKLGDNVKCLTGLDREPRQTRQQEAERNNKRQQETARDNQGAQRQGNIQKIHTQLLDKRGYVHVL